MNFRNITSVGISELNGVKVFAYQYDEIDDNGRVVKDNVRDTIMVLPTRANSELLGAIKLLEDLALEKANSR